MTAIQMFHRRKNRLALIANLSVLVACAWCEISNAQIVDPAARNRSADAQSTLPPVVPPHYVAPQRVNRSTQIVDPSNYRPNTISRRQSPPVTLPPGRPARGVVQPQSTSVQRPPVQTLPPAHQPNVRPRNEYVNRPDVLNAQPVAPAAVENEAPSSVKNSVQQFSDGLSYSTFLTPASYFTEDFGPRINPANDLTPIADFSSLQLPEILIPKVEAPPTAPDVIPEAPATVEVDETVYELSPPVEPSVESDVEPATAAIETERVQSSLTMPIATDVEPQKMTLEPSPAIEPTSIYGETEPVSQEVIVAASNEADVPVNDSALTLPVLPPQDPNPPAAIPPPVIPSAVNPPAAAPTRPLAILPATLPPTPLEGTQPEATQPEGTQPATAEPPVAALVIEETLSASNNEYQEESLSDSATSPALIPSLSEWTEPEQIQSTVKTMAFLAIVSLAPAVLLMTTSFVRISVVLSLLRQALGTQMLPSNQMVTSLSMFLSLLVMLPTWKQVYDDSIMPYSDPDIQMSAEEAWSAGVAPVRKFMADQIDRAGNAEDVMLFYQYLPDTNGTPQVPQYYEDVPLHVLLPAFMVSELKTAFLIGFQIFIPFLILDLVVSSLTVSTGMMMLPPATISLPLKLILFVLVDGWHLVAGMLLQSFMTG